MSLPATPNNESDAKSVKPQIVVPLRHRIALEKRVFRALALKYLPRDVVYRKKGFTISMERDDTTRRLSELLPTSIAGIPVNDMESRVAAGIFARWCEAHGVDCSTDRQ